MKRWGLWVAVAVVAVGGVVGAILVRTAGPQTPPSPSPAVVETGTQVVAAADARRLESDLSSGNPDRIRKALAIPAEQKLDPKFFARFAKLGKVTIRQDSAVRLDDTSARVYADLEHGEAETWTLLLTSVDGQWRVASTLEGEQR